MNPEHYFDWAATAPCDENILRESLETAIQYDGNPSASHKIGKEARKIFEEARESCAKSLGVKSNQVYFTSGGTESDHIPLLSVLNSPKKGRIIISAIEHPALREQCAMLKKQGFDVVSVNPDKNGFITVESIIEKVTSDTLFVTVMAVNNETGCIQPIYEIADALIEVAKGKKKPHFHTDCVQAAGKIPLKLSHAGIDSAALSAHKIGGPRGTGILYLSKPIIPFLTGGGQENNIRSGTENLFGAVAFSKCLEKYYLNTDKTNDQADEGFKKQKELTLSFIKELKKIERCSLVPQIREDFSTDIQDNFSPWIVQAAFSGIPGNVMLRALDAKGFSISTGSACSAKKQSRPILAAMNASKEIQDSSVRFSFGPASTKKSMDELIEAINEINKAF
jgi:cysteine desulfurase